MSEEQIANQVAKNIQTETHIPAPVVEDQPQQSAFDSNVELNNPLTSLQLTDYFNLSRVDIYNEHTQRQLRDVFNWAALS